MAEIFVSYARNDVERVRPLVETLEARGFSVWWDTRIGLGSSFGREIEQQLEAASAVIVVWSESSVDSDWVREEADEGLRREILLPVRIDGCRIPLGFRRAQTADLIGWPASDDALAPIITRLTQLVGARGALEPAGDDSTPSTEMVIAVLAFANRSNDPDIEFLCEGIAEELMNVLFKLPGLRVSSATDTFRYKGKDVGITDIGRQLGAEIVLEGSVQKAQGRLAVSARLVKVADGHTLWSYRIIRKGDDIFSIQAEIAREAVDGLRAGLGLYRSPEALVVGFARTGDRNAFAELVQRRQSWIRNLMRRCCGDPTLADDLAQQVFLQAWRKISHLRQPDRFGPWLKRLAINLWLQHLRANDALRDAAEYDEATQAPQDATSVAMDLDHALATLSKPERLCVVLSYREGMTHAEIAEAVDVPLGTVKSHIRRGTQHLRQLLSAYRETSQAEESP